MRAVRPLIQNAICQRPLLQTNVGGMMGSYLQTSDDQQISAFLSVPFAQPPLNQLRFEAPIWPAQITMREAVKMPEASNKTEDCLYLNLFVPTEKSSESNGYPLLLFIPGGGFDRTTCIPHSLPYMAEHYCKRGIAYATLQYRVGLFGFGSDGSDDFRGNYALTDIRQALMFLHENAKRIGFDSNRITLAGHSAGASILSALSVSPKSRNLFSQAIQFSGSSLSLISTGNLVENETQKIVTKLIGSTSKVANPKELLKQFAFKDILKAYKEIGPPMNGANVIRFSPRVDGDFIPKDYFDLISESPPKPTLNTNSHNEGVVFALFNYLESIAEISPLEAKNFNVEVFQKKIRDLWGTQIESDINEMSKFYLSSKDHDDNLRYLRAYTKAIHDCYFAIPARVEMLEKMRCGWNVFNGIFGRLHQAVHPPQIPLKVPTHGSEYIYLFGHLKDSENLFNEADKVYRDFWIQSIVDFVKTGSPKSTRNSQWEQATNEKPHTVLRVDDSGYNLEHSDKELKFWNELNQRCKYNIYRQIPLV